MQRTRSQVLFRYLTESVFIHEDDLVAKVFGTDFNNVDSAVNKAALLDELSNQLSRWPAQRVVGIPRPGTVPDSEFVLIEPGLVYWDVWPLQFTCSNGACQRAVQFNHKQALAVARSENGFTCRACHAPLKQLRYYAVHRCGKVRSLYMPPCKHCKSRDHVYLEDTGSFETASWRCRGCGNAYIQGTRFTPCTCGSEYLEPGKKTPFMTAVPIRDQRTWRPQSMSLINLRDRSYDRLQEHAQRGMATILSYTGDETRVADGLDDLDRVSGGTTRLTAEEWLKKEDLLREMDLSDDDIEILRGKQAPLETGPEALRGLAPEVIGVGERRAMLERAVLFDRAIVSDRRTLDEAVADEIARGRTINAEALREAGDRGRQMGINEVSVTLSFPILLAAYGYTRQRSRPGQSHLHGFATRGRYEGKTPIFASVTNTEALFVTLSATAVLDFLVARGEVQGPVPATEREARLAVLALHADGDPSAETATILVHSLSHAMLRALDDGLSGFGESSLAEWVVPEALTFAVYVGAHQAHTLGALWTLMHTRTGSWLDKTAASVWRCPNDPLCHHRDSCACERCMFLTFGCRSFNAELSRRLLMEFWRHRNVTAHVI